MTDALPDTGLKSAFEASLAIDVSHLDQDGLLKRKAELLGDARSFDQLTIEQATEFHACCVRLRHLAQPAGKPPAKSKKTVTSAASVVDDFT